LSKKLFDTEDELKDIKMPMLLRIADIPNMH
jgi:hypothetical protein